MEAIYDLDKLKLIDLELKDYLHYYLGCRYRIEWPNGDYVEDCLDFLSKSGWISGINKAANKKGNTHYDSFDCEVFTDALSFKLILTHPCDMTKQQQDEYRSFCYPVEDFNKRQKILRYSDTPLSMHYLFKYGIDAFDLIEKGLAIDKKLHL